MKIQIRRAIKEDAQGIVEVNTYTWLTTYRELMPNEVLNNRLKTMNERISKIENSITQNNNIFVATDNDKIVGIITYGPSRNKQYQTSGEIYSLYVLDEYQGNGIGKKLFMKGIEELINNKYNSMIVNVLDGNKTIHFYEKYGGKAIDKQKALFGSTSLTEIVMYFNDLKTIYDNYSKYYYIL